jgi:3-deoxy-D-manno-octulosonic-acid transferase
VLFGPAHHASRDARLLLDADAAVTVADGGTLERTVETWLAMPDERRAAGEAALAVVHRGLGAATRSWALIESLLA